MSDIQPRDADADAAARIARDAVAAIEAGDRVDASAVLLLIHRYAHDDDDAAGAALATALGALVDAALDPTAAGAIGADALVALAAAVSVADDEQVAAAALAGARSLARRWNGPAAVATRMAEVEAVLHAGRAVSDDQLIASAIDELERVVGASYEPGDGLGGATDASEADAFADQVSAASALLAAYEITGRLPYAMLAEELMQIARSAARRRAAGATSAAAARVWCRLAALHADDEYMRAAVVARDADYAADAGRLLEEIAPVSPPGWRDAPWALASIAYRVVASRPPHPS